MVAFFQKNHLYVEYILTDIVEIPADIRGIKNKWGFWVFLITFPHDEKLI